jgi:trk system potassium uptake protein TrkH
MPIFDSVCHAFGTLATGGFSTQNGSIGQYNSAYFDWVITIFMFLAGMNFLLHFQVIFKRDFSGLKKNSEFHFYTAVVLIATLISTLVLWLHGLPGVEELSHSFRHTPIPLDQLEVIRAQESAKVSTFFSSLRYSAFQVLAVITTTGYATADFDMWPNIIRTLFVLLMFFGGSAGSTGGGIKMIRIQVIMKSMHREIRRLVQPRIVKSVKLGETPIDEKQVSNIIGFFLLYILSFVLLSLIMSLFIDDFTTAVTSVVATLSNIGPGLSGVGAAENFNWIPTGGKWVLTFAMLLGRLELYTVVIALSPLSWKR